FVARELVHGHGVPRLPQKCLDVLIARPARPGKRAVLVLIRRVIKQVRCAQQATACVLGDAGSMVVSAECPPDGHAKSGNGWSCPEGPPVWCPCTQAGPDLWRPTVGLPTPVVRHRPVAEGALSSRRHEALSTVVDRPPRSVACAAAVRLL